MKTRRTLPIDASVEIFDAAVRDRALAVLSVQEDGQWISFKSRFLERDPRRQFFVLDYQSFDGVPLPELMPGRYVGVSFRYRSRKVMFSSSVQARGHFVLEPNHSIAAVRYRWPDTITELQRRAYYRTPIPENQVLLATLWPDGLARHDASAGAAGRPGGVSGQILDISCGGAFIRLNQVDPPDWPENRTIGVELQLGDNHGPLLLDVRFRTARVDANGEVGVAIQFVGLEMTPDGRMVLQRLAHCVQRFHRMSILSGSQPWMR